jgi:ParB family chromosome partitioning protein
MSAIKNRGLGKGLEALFSDVEISVDDLNESSEQGRIHQIDIHKIKPSKSQPRTYFNEDRLQELASSIEEHGILQPIIVQSLDNGYVIVAGERRWRAAIKAGLKEVPCIIKDLTEEEIMLLALIENMQREDLNPIEEAKGISTMLTNFGLTQEEVSKSVGKSRPYITNSLRLLRLPDSVQEMVIDGRLTSGHARAIAGVSDSDKQTESLSSASRMVAGILSNPAIIVALSLRSPAISKYFPPTFLTIIGCITPNSFMEEHNSSRSSS